jgi:GNAT superfamily N-acetyltransferase
MSSASISCVSSHSLAQQLQQQPQASAAALTVTVEQTAMVEQTVTTGQTAAAGQTPTLTGLAASDTFEPGTFAAIFEALDATSRHLIGPALPRLLVIPIRADDGSVAGGFWGCTVFQWLHVQMLFVPEKLRGLGVGSALMAAAEAAARDRGCCGAHVDTFSFQAAPFYRKLGFTLFGVLEDFPPGYSRLFFRKRFDSPAGHSAVASPLGA